MATVTNPLEYYTTWSNGFFSKKILVEGDSWVSHPRVNNLAVQFDFDDPDEHLVLSLGVPGDNAGSVYGNSDAVFRANGPQMRKLKRLLNTSQWGESFDLIFISAAGNDIIGPEIRAIPLVNNKRDYPAAYGRDLINLNFFSKLDRIIQGYRRFMRMVRGGSLNADTPVITHTYAYLKPRQVGTHFFGIQFHRGWVAQHLRHQGITDPDEQYEIIQAMFDRYHQRITALEQEFSKFLVVDTRRTLLRNGRPNTDWFHDEIHPTSAGFTRLYRKIRREARAAGLWTLDS